MVMAMTMYLPNWDVRAIGDEAAEFIEPATFAPAADLGAGDPEDPEDDNDDERA